MMDLKVMKSALINGCAVNLKKICFLYGMNVPGNSRMEPGPVIGHNMKPISRAMVIWAASIRSISLVLKATPLHFFISCPTGSIILRLRPNVAGVAILNGDCLLTIRPMHTQTLRVQQIGYVRNMKIVSMQQPLIILQPGWTGQKMAQATEILFLLWMVTKGFLYLPELPKKGQRSCSMHQVHTMLMVML